MTKALSCFAHTRDTHLVDRGRRSESTGAHESARHPERSNSGSGGDLHGVLFGLLEREREVGKSVDKVTHDD